MGAGAQAHLQLCPGVRMRRELGPASSQPRLSETQAPFRRVSLSFERAQINPEGRASSPRSHDPIHSPQCSLRMSNPYPGSRMRPAASRGQASHTPGPVEEEKGQSVLGVWASSLGVSAMASCPPRGDLSQWADRAPSSCPLRLFLFWAVVSAEGTP